MLKQVAFKDKRGVEWLNRPGPKRGVPGIVIPIVSLIPTSMIGTLNQFEITGYAILLGIFSFIFYTVALVMSLIIRLYYQTCPECHTTRMKGYHVCSGCGYPQSWS